MDLWGLGSQRCYTKQSDPNTRPSQHKTLYGGVGAKDFYGILKHVQSAIYWSAIEAGLFSV